jgi:hypothetical protein
MRYYINHTYPAAIVKAHANTNRTYIILKEILLVSGHVNAIDYTLNWLNCENDDSDLWLELKTGVESFHNLTTSLLNLLIHRTFVGQT